jgi:TetR/AcrR family transcriptional repressor of bet genes
VFFKKYLRADMPKVVNHEERRRELVEASWDVIANSGIEGVTMRSVATAAGCTTGRISHYFSGREGLLTSALKIAHEDAEVRMMKIVASDLSPKEKLVKVAFEGLPLDANRLREWKVWIVFWAAAASSQQLAEQNKSRYREWRGLVTRLLTELSSEAQLTMRVEEILSLIDGLGLRVSLNPTAESRRMAREVISLWVARLDD